MSPYTIEQYRQWLKGRLEIEKRSGTPEGYSTLQSAKWKFDEIFPMIEDDSKASRIKPLGFDDPPFRFIDDFEENF